MREFTRKSIDPSKVPIRISIRTRHMVLRTRTEPDVKENEGLLVERSPLKTAACAFRRFSVSFAVHGNDFFLGFAKNIVFLAHFDEGLQGFVQVLDLVAC